eukprot:1820770-Ditylum_brightwellii.AAC.1
MEWHPCTRARRHLDVVPWSACGRYDGARAHWGCCVGSARVAMSCSIGGNCDVTSGRCACTPALGSWVVT